MNRIATTRPAGTNVWRLVAVALLPLLVLGLLIAALWDPAQRLDTVRAAIVNHDQPVTVDGQLVPLGRQLAAGLVSGAAPSTEQTVKAAAASDAGYSWEITDAAHARAGLADGTFAAVVTIPKDFSAAATSFSGDDASKARQATIDVSTPPGGRVGDEVIARAVASTATSVLGSSLTKTYVDNVLVGFGTVSEQLGKASDGAGQLATGATQAAGGAHQLSDGAGQLATGAQTASGGAGQLANGAGQLASGARSASTGAAQLAAGAQQAAGGASGLATGASTLADGAGKLADGAGEVADGIGQSKAGADQLADGAGALKTQLQGAAAGAQDAAAGVADAGAGVEGYAGGVTDLANALRAREAYGCDTATPADACAQLPSLGQIADGLDGVVSGNGTAENPGLDGIAAGLTAAAGTVSDDPAKGSQSLYALANGLSTAATKGAGGLQTGAGKLGSGLGRLETGADRVATGATGLESGARQLSSGATSLSGGVGRLAGGAQDLAGGVGQLATGASGVASGAGSLADGVGQLAAGASGVSTGAQDLAGGVGQLAGGAGDLSHGLGQAVDQLPTYSERDRKTLAAVVANPVASPGADSLDTGTTGPLFAVVALWLGALGLTAVVRPSRARALGTTAGALRIALADLALPAAIAVGTGAVVGGVLAAVEHLSPGGWAGAVALGALISVVFVAVHQGFCLLLGDVARGISLLMAVLVIATGVVPTVPAWLSSLADLLAIGAARDALVGVTVPAAGGVGGAVVGLVLWGLLGVALAAFATARRRTVGVSALLAAER